MEQDPPRPTPRQADEMRRRRRGRNIALLVALIALAVLFYAISIVKLRHQVG
ncbi:MAG TPA: hypothetical protein VMB34_05005 [Acetobacteraceae bacterium]|nr:hypothetical protein [Acetobacteraceae bacterium]